MYYFGINCNIDFCFINEKDHKTKEPFTKKNIIITKVPYNVMPDNYYCNLKNTGSGKGYYVTKQLSITKSSLPSIIPIVSLVA